MEIIQFIKYILKLEQALAFKVLDIRSTGHSCYQFSLHVKPLPKTFINNSALIVNPIFLRICIWSENQKCLCQSFVYILYQWFVMRTIVDFIDKIPTQQQMTLFTIGNVKAQQVDFNYHKLTKILYPIMDLWTLIHFCK